MRAPTHLHSLAVHQRIIGVGHIPDPYPSVRLRSYHCFPNGLRTQVMGGAGAECDAGDRPEGGRAWQGDCAAVLLQLPPCGLRHDDCQDGEDQRQTANGAEGHNCPASACAAWRMHYLVAPLPTGILPSCGLGRQTEGIPLHFKGIDTVELDGGGHAGIQRI